MCAPKWLEDSVTAEIDLIQVTYAVMKVPL